MKFERFKNRLPQEYRDINKLTPDTLYDQVKDFSLEKTKASKEEKKEAYIILTLLFNPVFKSQGVRI